MFSAPQGKAGEKAAMAVQNKMNLQTAPIRTYLDSTVVPVLLQGLSALVKERCAHPARDPTPVLSWGAMVVGREEGGQVCERASE